MNENGDMDYYSDDEVNRKTHSRLLDEVLQLDKRQYVKKPSRTEPSTHVSEFTLVKPSAGRRNTINIGDLTKSLKQKSKHVIISNKVKSATTKAKTLRKPLEKPQAEKIRRSIGFQKTKSELNKWNSVVDKNRVAAQLVFPLNQGEIDFKVLHSKNIEFPKRYKSELDIELEKLEPQPEPAVEEDQFPLSMEELVQKRKEMARLRAHQSYQEAKAYKRNKIKSKMFHRIQRKERIKQQIKEFEELKKTDPEEALRKLEQLEKTRAEERMSLRHRSTGQWAKNKQIRAKYDKESRQAISQQLTISRELTEKRALHMDSDSDSDDHINADNLPQVNIDQTSDVNEFVSGYRKFWNEQNKNESQPNQITTNTFVADEFSDSETEYAPYDDKKTNVTENGRQIKQVKKESSQLTDNQTKDIVSKCNILKDKRKKKKTKQREESFCNNQWTVTPMKDEIMKASDTLVENMFDNLEYETLNKINTKIDKLKNVPVPKKQTLSFITGQVNEKQSEFPREKLRPVVDEELTNEDVDNLYPKKTLESSDSGFWSLSNADETDSDIGKTMIDSSVNIDPNNFLTVKETILDTKLPTIATGDDNSDSDNDQRAFIAEAFKDDDLMEEFSKEKQDVIDKDKPKDVDLTLPGWGAWGGKGVKVSKRKRKRFIVKAPSEVPRRDDNKGTLIINEHKDTKVRKHQVSEVPFPFKTVKDYEASIRAPIGDTFVPQTAFRRLIKPSLVTKKGTIIEPMSKDALLNQKFTQNGRLVKR